MMNTSPILTLKNIDMVFGGVQALKNVNIDVMDGEILGIIGPNGAGKTTVFNVITGSITPTNGQVLYKGENIVGKRVDQICHLGISRTFQNIRLFPQMSVFENVALARHSIPTHSVLESFLPMKHAKREKIRLNEEVIEFLKMVNLDHLADQAAATLPYGLQRRLEIARAMAADPKVLLLDEPAAGMNADECQDLIQMIRSIHEKLGYTILLIEHHMNVVMELCRNHRIVVLNLGEILAEGSPAEIQTNPDVIDAYLGSKRIKHHEIDTAIS
jgi:branched-chain amino acid transport system ATP-binding protein